MKFLRSKYLIIGTLAGLLLGGGWFTWAAIQSQVGLNVFDADTATWNPAMSTAAGEVSISRLKNLPFTAPTVNVQSDGSYSPQTASDANNAASSRLQGVALYVFNGTDNVGNTRVRNPSADASIKDGIISSGAMVFNGVTFDRQRSAGIGDGAASTGIQANAGFLFNGSTFDRKRSVSTANLTAVTSTGTTANVPLSTWSITNTPAAATQATVSKASGGGTVRHVATSITACTAQTAAAQTPIAINLRDGATGAGTVLRTWKIASIISDSKCVDLSGLAMIGSAATAMTIEFAAAGVAGSEQTVTLTGFSVP